MQSYPKALQPPGPPSICGRQNRDYRISVWAKRQEKQHKKYPLEAYTPLYLQPFSFDHLEILNLGMLPLIDDPHLMDDSSHATAPFRDTVVERSHAAGLEPKLNIEGTRDANASTLTEMIFCCGSEFFARGRYWHLTLLLRDPVICIHRRLFCHMHRAVNSRGLRTRLSVREKLFDYGVAGG